ncbi:ficolin-1-like [Ixodes scapularis]|uniref:ficolin-1-like n=1 Tax=Ixodes scapularis TaxID=6945 RepID=UPI001A9D220D|nr:ficolin-1-like [Ixodes scapularis]
MFVVSLFIPLVAGNVFMESSIRRVPEITERQHTPTKTYMIFDPCNTNKPGNRTISCSQIKMRERSRSGEYVIYPRNDPVNVRCDMESDGGGWTVIQQRTKYEANDNNFEKNERDYELGFGASGSSYWIGNENLHALTSFPNNQQSLRIELTRTGEEKPTVVLYHKFHVGSKEEKYKLTIDEYEGPDVTGYDALSYHNGEKFTIKKSMTRTPDKDKCSDRLSGGWWFKECNEANLNGRKFTYTSQTKALGITWHIKDKEESYEYIYEKVEMKIRDNDFGFCTGALKSQLT